MFIKLISQLLVATALFQFFPADAGELELYATQPESVERHFDLLETYEHLSQRLPAAADRNRAPVKVDVTSMGVVTTAQSAIVVDRTSGEVLFEKNIHDPRSIGSITKLMTAYVFMQTNPDLDAEATLLSEDVRLGASMKLPVGETVTVRNLLEASLIGSDNTSTAALARLSGMPLSDFIARMNESAALMGMQQTTFADTTGLSSNNRSVVTDLVTMLDEILKDETIRDITQIPEIVITGASGRQYYIDSTDELLETFVNEPPYEIVGAKTGFLPEAGYCLGTIFDHENAGELIVVVLGSESKSGRFQDVKSLAVWAYDVHEWSQL